MRRFALVLNWRGGARGPFSSGRDRAIVGNAPTPSGKGYLLVATEGEIFTFGDAAFSGSLPGTSVPGPAVSMRPTRTGGGYLITRAAGRVAAFGDAPVLGDVPETAPAAPSSAWRSRRLRPRHEKLVSEFLA